MPQLWLGEMLSEKISNLSLGRHEANLDSISSKGFNEPVNGDTVRSRNMPQGARAALRNDFDDCLVVLSKNEFGGGTWPTTRVSCVSWVNALIQNVIHVRRIGLARRIWLSVGKTGWCA
jgi:hypothetical protein